MAAEQWALSLHVRIQVAAHGACVVGAYTGVLAGLLWTSSLLDGAYTLLHASIILVCSLSLLGWRVCMRFDTLHVPPSPRVDSGARHARAVLSLFWPELLCVFMGGAMGFLFPPPHYSFAFRGIQWTFGWCVACILLAQAVILFHSMCCEGRSCVPTRRAASAAPDERVPAAETAQ